jgi:hypothetical protein
MAVMGNAELRMARLIASTLVLAGTAWVSAGSPSVGEQPARQVRPRLEAARNQHDANALASLFTGVRSLVSAAVAQVPWDSPGEISPDGAAHPQRSGWMPLVSTPPSGPWLVAAAHNTNLLANPPPR